MLDFVLELQDDSVQIGNLQTLLIERLVKFAFLIVISLLNVMDVFVQLLNFVAEKFSLLMPLVGLPGLSLKPLVVFIFDVVQLSVQLVNGPLVESQHLLHLQVQCLDFLVFPCYLFLKVILLLHYLLHVQISALKKTVVRNMGQSGLGGVGLNFLETLMDNILHLLLHFVMTNCKLCQPQLVIPSLVKSILNLSCQFLPGVLELLPQIVSFVGVVGKTALHLAPDTLKIRLV